MFPEKQAANESTGEKRENAFLSVFIFWFYCEGLRA